MSPRPGQRQSNDYLQYLIDRYQYLELKGMGISDQVPLQLPLAELYVPLRVRRNVRLEDSRSSQNIEELLEPGPENPNVGTVPAIELIRNSRATVILGDPGSGKTTLLKYLALQLASGNGSGLGIQGRMPILMPLSAYATAMKDSDVSIERFICQYYEQRIPGVEVSRQITSWLENGSSMVMLDGIDEVHDLGERHLTVQRIEDFVSYRGRAGNIFVATSRIIGYRAVRPELQGLAEATIIELGEDSIEEFVERWTYVLEAAARGTTHFAGEESADQRRDLLAVIQRSPGVRRLASNPMLLTIIALMKRQGIALPERRVELYDKAVSALLKYWNLARGLGRPPSRDLDMLEAMRLLSPIAEWMQGEPSGVGLVSGRRLQNMLRESFADRGSEDPEKDALRFMDDIREYAGLLVERGPDEYAFIHLTFQEYLAAVAVVSRAQSGMDPIIYFIKSNIEADVWHEVSLLVIGYLAVIQQRDIAAAEVIDAILAGGSGRAGAMSVLAGQALVDILPGGIDRSATDKVRHRLLVTATDELHVDGRVRQLAGDALAALGDLRSEVLYSDEMPFCYVPPGPFFMGLENATIVESAQEFWVGRFPVTVAQFAEFGRDGGYERRELWTDVGWAWRSDEAALHPAVVPERFSLSNHPAVAVTWHEAIAFARWLSLRVANRTIELGVRLLTEPEWEKSARGGFMVPATVVVRSLSDIDIRPPKFEIVENRYPQRRYPWGDNEDIRRVACAGAGVDCTAMVGSFAAGRSPYGAEDMAGNVWEWLQTAWGSEWRTPKYSLPYTVEDDREGLDYPDTMLRMVRGGCYLVGSPGSGETWKHLSCSYRTRNGPDVRHINHGFRVCLVPRTGR